MNITNFQGGLADSKYRGINGSFAPGSFGIDVHSNPGVLQANWKLTKDSGSTVTELLLHHVASSDGSSYFAGDAGGIYKRTSGGSWSKVYTQSGSVRICGFTEYNGYFVWATSDTLFKMAIGGNWSAGITQYNGSIWTSSGTTWTGNEIDTSWHQMVKVGTYLYIMAGQYVTYLNTSFAVSLEILDLPPDWNITTAAIWNDYLLIAANSKVKDTCAVFVWDGYSDSWSTQLAIPEDKIYSLISDGTKAYIIAGNQGNIYQFIVNDAPLLKKIPGTFTASAYLAHNANAVALLNGYLLFGVGNGANNPCSQGVYGWGALNKNYPKVLGLDYILSTTYQSGVQVGCIGIDSGSVFISWKDTTGGTTYGVDKIDYTARYNNATYLTTVIGGNQKYIFSRLFINMEPLPASCSVTVKYRINGATGWTSLASTSTANVTNLEWSERIPFNTIEFQVILGTSGTSTPAINALEFDINEIGQKA